MQLFNFPLRSMALQGVAMSIKPLLGKGQRVHTLGMIATDLSLSSFSWAPLVRRVQ